MSRATDADVMPSEPRGLFLLLRRLEDLERAGPDLTAYLTVRRRWSLTPDPDVIQGIWIGEEGVANLPVALTLPGDDGTCRSVRIAEATGVNGIWMLCWLDAPARTVSHADLVAALLECGGDEAGAATASTAHFIPVFAGEAPLCEAGDDMQTLKRRYPGLVLSPVHVGADGTLRLPPADSHGKEAP